MDNNKIFQYICNKLFQIILSIKKNLSEKKLYKNIYYI